MKIFLVRHGQTKWNKDSICRGRLDVELDETGISQAAATGKALSHLEFEAVYSSPLKRAMKTAEEIAAFHKSHNPNSNIALTVTPVDGLIDIDFGEWQGLTIEEVSQRYPDIYRLWQREPQNVRFPGGESLDEVSQRATSAMKSLIAKHPEGNIVMVSHRVVNKVLLCAALGLDNSHFWLIGQDTCCINVIEPAYDRYIIHTLNDTCHIKRLGEVPTLRYF
ncbi:MAG: histidine phosphatase family protein [Firmicutes bacterium]|nr:histidine phosphatase family protein [Bacillota bacterium]